MTNVLWFLIVAFLVSGFAVLDGFDLGVGAMHFLLGRTVEERNVNIAAIGPVWNGNEVWLLAAGGALVVAFPHLYAAAFSGFYLALMLVLWLLMLRGISLEFRHQLDSRPWLEIWDFTFCLSSTLLAVLFGVAVGNALYGVPIGSGQEFTGSFAVLLNPFSIVCGVLSLLVLATHGSAYIALKTTGDHQKRARAYVSGLWFVELVVLAVVVVWGKGVHPAWPGQFVKNPILLVIPLIAVIAFVNVLLSARAGNDKKTFLSSMVFIIGTLGTTAAGVFPNVLFSRPGSIGPDLTIYNTASPENAQKLALYSFVVGAALLSVYLWQVYRTWGGKVTDDSSYH